MDAERKCAACDKVKQETEFKQKRDGFNAVCKQCSENRKAARDRKKAELEGDSGKENTPTVTEDENEEEEHLRKELNKFTLEQFIDALMATEDVRSLTTFVDLSVLEVENDSEREKADKLAEAIWEQLKYRFV
jgi:hypothetical protein